MKKLLSVLGFVTLTGTSFISFLQASTSTEILISSAVPSNIIAFEMIAMSDRKENDILNLVLEDLDLSVRSYNCLKREGYKTLGDFYYKKLIELKNIENLGDKSLEDIITSVLTVFGISKVIINFIIAKIRYNFDNWKDKSLKNIVDEI